MWIAIQILFLPQYAMRYDPTMGECVIGTINRNLADANSAEIAEVYINEDVRAQLSDVITRPLG